MNCSRPPRMQPEKKQPSRKVIRRLEQIENLPPHQQGALLTTIDAFLSSAENREPDLEDGCPAALRTEKHKLLIVETTRSGAAVKDDRREPRSGLAP